MKNLERYSEVLLEIDGWRLLKKTVKDLYGQSYYDSMIQHDCAFDQSRKLRNGLMGQSCYECRRHVPDEIWVLWIFHNGGI